MRKHPRQYDREYKITALKELERCENGPRVARAFKIDLKTLYRWYREAQHGKIPGFTPNGKFQIQTHNTYTPEFKRQAVKEVEAGESIRGVAKKRKITRASLKQWIKDLGASVPSPPRFGKAEAETAIAELRAGERKEEQARQARVRAERAHARKVQEMVADPLVWMQKYTETKDGHWREHGATSPFRPFPEKAYLRAMMNGLKNDPIAFIEKSRNLLLSWLCVGYFTHAAMTNPGIEVFFQSQKEDKACELVEYARILYDRQRPELKEAFPLEKRLREMAESELRFANRSRIVGIPAGADQIRSCHPWGLFMDEAAFMPEAAECYNNAVSVCKKIIVLSSAGPGWFADVSASATGFAANGSSLAGQFPMPGFSVRYTPRFIPFYRVHYSADPDRNAEWAAKERRKYTSLANWYREQEIVYEACG